MHTPPFTPPRKTPVVSRTRKLKSESESFTSESQKLTKIHRDAARVGASASAPTFGDALDASRGMVALSQDLTPRNIYGPGPRGTRGSADSYGFPSAQSSASSISSGGNYPYYSASVGSVDSSVTDYSSTTSESYESRTLPRPTSLLAGSAPPGPQSMMSQFSSKMPSNTQKKHKCKVCDKRFTRPSSLQTHMYSHTGEKRKFALF